MLIVENKTIDYISANFTENETAWDSGDTYNYSDEIRDGHFIYKYAGEDGTNTAQSPAVDVNNATAKWVEIKPTNYYAMLDGKTATQTLNDDKIDITIEDINYDSISLIGLNAKDVQLILTDINNNEEVFNKTIELVDNTEIIDFFTYSFNEFDLITSIYKRLPIYANARLQIIINNDGNVAGCGRLVFGRSYYVGQTNFGINLGLDSYSRKIVDEFGGATLKHVGATNNDSYEIMVKTTKVPLLIRKAKELDAIPLLFVGDESDNSQVEHLLNYGYWENFSMLIPDPIKSTINLTIKGII